MVFKILDACFPFSFATGIIRLYFNDNQISLKFSPYEKTTPEIIYSTDKYMTFYEYFLKIFSVQKNPLTITRLKNIGKLLKKRFLKWRLIKNIPSFLIPGLSYRCDQPQDMAIYQSFKTGKYFIEFYSNFKGRKCVLEFTTKQQCYAFLLRMYPLQTSEVKTLITELYNSDIESIKGCSSSIEIKNSPVKKRLSIERKRMRENDIYHNFVRGGNFYKRRRIC